MTVHLTTGRGESLELYPTDGLPVILALCETEGRTRDHTLLPDGTRLCHRCAATPPAPPQRPHLRPRLQYRSWPRPRLILTDTPHPGCAQCDGHGGWGEDYADAEGEYGGTEEVTCLCWAPDRAWTVLPFPRRPRWLRRRTASADPWSTEPPF